MLTVAVAQSLVRPFSDYNESCYVLPVLQMMSRLRVIGKAKRTGCILTHQVAALGKVMMFIQLICHYYTELQKEKRTKKNKNKD